MMNLISKSTPPRGQIPTTKRILSLCPWDTSSGAPREQARRIASQIQAREYMLWILELHPPNLSVAHGIAEMFWARDGVILEEVITGYALWTLGVHRKVAASFGDSLAAIQVERPLVKVLVERVERARRGRNRATHGRKAPSVKTDYRPLTPTGLRRQLDPDLINDVLRALAARR